MIPQSGAAAGPVDASALTEPALFAALGSGPEGLTAEAARERLARDGPNQISPPDQQTALGLLLRQLANPLSWILLFAAGIAGAVGEWLDAAIVLAMVLGSVILGFLQEYRASAAVTALRARLALTARVRRDGAVTGVPFAEIVVGDVVLLSAGAVAPADARVLSAQNLLINEAPLTGESFPVEKRPGVLAPGAPVAGRWNSVFLGTAVQSGSAEAVVVRTGRATEFGAIADRLRAQPAESEFGRSMRRFGGLLLRVMVGVVLFVLIVNQLLGRPFLDSLLFAVALGVGMSPEFLPAIVSVTLSAGARKLAAAGVLVRRLEAIEDLGGMTVFCTDKTGTLTEGAVKLEAVLDTAGAPSETVAQLAMLNAAFEAGIDNPLDAAIRAAGAARGLGTAGYVKLGEIPYDFVRKRLTVVVRGDDAQPMLITKGAYDNVLAACTHWMTPAGPAPLDAAARAKLDADYQAQGEQGLRLLALATGRPGSAPYGVADEAGLCLHGFLAFLDPPKPEAAVAIRNLAALGVTVKVISGDNRHVVAHVAHAVGIDAAAMITGDQLAAISDAALARRVADVSLFAEVDPQQKERIVRALQRAGHAVGYLGDGINDAPALHAADVGISVDQAVDVARESADVVLLRRDLDVLRLGIEGGRRTFANTLKYICVTISANFGNMVSMALAAPVLPFMPMLAKQILLNNFLSDLPAVSLATDSVDAAQLATPQRMGVRDIQRFMIVFGLISSVFDLVTFVFLLRVVDATAAGFQTAWFVLSLLTELAALLVLRTQGPAWRSRPGKVLVGISIGVAAVALAAPYLGPLSRIFGLVPLGLDDMAVLLGIMAAYVVATEAGKRIFYRHLRTRPPRRAGSVHRRAVRLWGS